MESRLNAAESPLAALTLLMCSRRRSRRAGGNCVRNGCPEEEEFLMKVASALSLCVGLTLAGAAGTASAAPKGHLQKAPPVSRMEPLRTRGVHLVDSRHVIPTTPWHDYHGGASRGQ